MVRKGTPQVEEQIGLEDEDAVEAVRDLLPLDDKPHKFRSGQFTIQVTPPKEDTVSTRTYRHRLNLYVENGQG